MNLFSNLARTLGFGDDVTETDREAAKRERVEHHRLYVRNGPVKLRTVSTGQVRRAQVRSIEAQTRRNFRAAVRTHKASLLEVGALRGHLQRVGLLDYLSDFTPTPAGQHASAWWLVDRFRGDDNRLVGDEIMLTCFQRALDRHNELTGAPAMTIPDTYRIPDSVGRWQTVGYSVEDGS